MADAGGRGDGPGVAGAGCAWTGGCGGAGVAGAGCWWGCAVARWPTSAAPATRPEPSSVRRVTVMRFLAERMRSPAVLGKGARGLEHDAAQERGHLDHGVGVAPGGVEQLQVTVGERLAGGDQREQVGVHGVVVLERLV